ncbi:uncharacterized protein LOC121990365 [Zingiber officinale]|uniref:uncharacterized protein LOC121990365 n=1 Tax=Zingiber officinale TaxID=94328 RepID=UPI001C4C215E|nr:uncharacterized protein LOC121990365 [Zingiber officinale]
MAGNSHVKTRILNRLNGHNYQMVLQLSEEFKKLENDPVGLVIVKANGKVFFLEEMLLNIIITRLQNSKVLVEENVSATRQAFLQLQNSKVLAEEKVSATRQVFLQLQNSKVSAEEKVSATRQAFLQNSAEEKTRFFKNKTYRY